MTADGSYRVCMKSKHDSVQVTVRGIPGPVVDTMRQRASHSGKSLNRVLVEALTLAAGLGSGDLRHRDLSDLAGSWVEDPDFDAALEAQDLIDGSLWE
jgi:hypothetical protein